jgi:hypothetical protein
MHLILSIFAAFGGSLLGAAARAGMDAAERRMKGEPEPEMVSINGSLAAALAGGLAGVVLGVRRAFWIGAVLGAAGASRADAILLGKVGIDTDALMAKAMAAAERARAARSGGRPEPEAAAEPEAVEPDAG